MSVHAIRNIITGLFHVPAGPRGTRTQSDDWRAEGYLYHTMVGARSAARYLYTTRGYRREDLEIVSYNLVRIASEPA